MCSSDLGMHLLADKPIRVGDYVKIADTTEGYVVDIGWRSTRLRMLQNTVVVVPNKKVAESVITNYDLGETRMAVFIRVGVDYDADPDHVERVLVDEATRAVADVPGLLGDPPPVARLIPGFGDYSLDFTLNVEVASFVEDRDPVPGADGGAARRAVRGVAGLRPRARRERALGRGRARRSHACRRRSDRRAHRRLRRARRPPRSGCRDPAARGHC